MADYDEKTPGCNDVSPDSGYTMEAGIQERTANGWGDSQTRLPKGHLARRDTPAERKSLKAR